MIVAHDSMMSWLSSLSEDAQLSVVLQTGLRDLGALLQADTHWRRFGESDPRELIEVDVEHGTSIHNEACSRDRIHRRVPSRMNSAKIKFLPSSRARSCMRCKPSVT